jgi:DNA-binding PadR family transcriptional regulator
MPKRAMEILTESMFYVLMAFRSSPMCGIDIVDFIDRKTQGRIQMGPATLYTILGKFQKEKYIQETEVDGRKRTYCITKKGLDAYKDELTRLQLCVANAESERMDGDESHV